MEKKVIIGIIVVVIILNIFIFINPFKQKGDGQEENTPSSLNNLTENLTNNLNVECSSNQQCPTDSIESYCQNNSVYMKVHDFSCIDNKCIDETKEPELKKICSGGYDCIEGVCEHQSVSINSCGYYLNKENEFYKLIGHISNDGLTEACLTILKNNITLDCNGYSISDGNQTGILSEENSYITIKNCDVNVGPNSTGIYLYSNSQNSILNNTLNNQYVGLYLNWDTSSKIKGNTMDSNTYFGLWIEKSNNNEISDNTVCDNENQDLKIIRASNLQGTENKFGTLNQASDGWPIIETNYINCTS